MKICFLCNEYPPALHGGIGVVLQIVARQLAARGHEIRVAGVYSDLYGTPPYEEDHGVRVWRIPTAGRRLSVFHDRYGLYRVVADWARKGEIDLVESADYEGHTAFWPSLPCPVVVRLHGSGVYFALETSMPHCRKTYFFESAGLRQADFISSPSEYTARRTCEIFNLKRPYTVIYNPMDLPESVPQRSVARPAQTIVFTGTLAQKKGVISLVHAWPKVLERFPAAKLDIYGKDGFHHGVSMRELLTGELRQADAASSVEFHGHVRRETMLQAFESARAAVFPSFSESFSLAPMESMVRGCPTIFSTRHAGPELIREGIDGLLVDPDNIDGMADAMCRVLGDDRLAARLGSAGIERIRDSFSIPVLAPKFEEYYQECVDQFRSRRRAA